MKLRAVGQEAIYDARLLFGGPVLQELGYRVAIRVTMDEKKVFVPPGALSRNFTVTWANRAEWKALRRYKFIGTSS